MLYLKSAAAIFSVFLLFLVLPSFITNEDDPLDKIASSLTNWTSNLPQEKVYLHMDKPYYALGDTIWFKAYVTIGSRHQLSALSGALYADLINEKGAIEKTLKLPVMAGTAWGDFTLSDTLSEGNYRIRAYTQWMRNAGEDYFFDRTFSVGNAFDYEVQAKVDYSYKTLDKQAALTALLSYTDEEGRPLEGKNVQYHIMAAQKAVGSRSVKTDAAGQVSILIQDGQKAEMQGAYIEATITTEDKKQVTKSFPIKAALSQSDVQFFPEGGSLVSGITSRVAFKAVGIDGLGIPVKGTVTDNTDQEVLSFESQHAGMGTFNLKPEAGKTYKAKIVYPDGSGTTVNLPKAEEEGFVLAVYQTGNDSLLIRVNASAKQYQTPQSISLVAQSGGEMIYASQIKITRPVTSVWIPKKDFPSGIAQFTIFSATGEPLNERITFINNPDKMQLNISSQKQSYKPREKVEITLDARDKSGKAAIGSFSVAVIDESKVPVDEASESTILSNILLSSDLKGYIEKPNYYFTKTDEAPEKVLDNLMLTQGYRRFTWKQMLTEASTEPKFPAEKITTEISGKVLTLAGMPLPNGKVTLLSLRGGIMLDTTSDSHGRFKFDGILLTDSIKFTVQAMDGKNRKNVEVVLDSVPKLLLSKNKNIGDINTDIAGSTKTYLENSKKEMDILERSGNINRMQYLKEVKIRSRRGNNSNISAQGMFKIPEGHADQTYILERPELIPNLGIYLQGKLHGVIFKPYESVQNYPYHAKDQSRMQVFLNGRKIDNLTEIAEIFDMNVVDPRDIARIEVVRTNLALLNFLGGGIPREAAEVEVPKTGACILIITKNQRSPRYFSNMANITPKGFNINREFYSPKYDHPKKANELPDFRSTVYWNPGLKTGTDGKTRFDFFNGDNIGTYKVIVEGVNAEGELGRQVYRYKVE